MSKHTHSTLFDEKDPIHRAVWQAMSVAYNKSERLRQLAYMGLMYEKAAAAGSGSSVNIVPVKHDHSENSEPRKAFDVSAMPNFGVK